MSDGNLALTWRTLLGQTYRVEYKNDLSQPQWSMLSDYHADGTSLTILDPIGAIPQRFYRIRQLD